MFKHISHNKGFHKLEKEGIKYNVSEKKFAILKSEGSIEESMIDVTPVTPVDIVNEDPKLMDLKKDALVELAQRLGFEGEITNAVTKSILVKFIEENQ